VNASTTRSLLPDRQFDRHLMTLCSLMLMVVLVVGATGYAGIQGLLSPSTIAAKAARIEQLKRAARPDRIVSPAAIALALIAGFLVVAADRTANPRRSPINTA
jgi:pheromone shutdown protein TraB